MSSKPMLASDFDSDKYSELYSLYPELMAERSAEWLNVLDKSQFAEAPADTVLASAGQSCKGFMLLLDGSVRIYQETGDGREMTLYRISKGDICLMSLNSLLKEKPFKANARSETPVRMLLISGEDFHLAQAVSSVFRSIIMTSLVDTVCTMVDSHYDTVFEPLDMRLACLLGRLFERAQSDSLNVTHQALAQELGTSREVISRLLKKLEQQECIVLRRGQINLGSKSIPGSSM